MEENLADAEFAWNGPFADDDDNEDISSYTQELEWRAIVVIIITFLHSLIVITIIIGRLVSNIFGADKFPRLTRFLDFCESSIAIIASECCFYVSSSLWDICQPVNNIRPVIFECSRSKASLPQSYIFMYIYDFIAQWL